MYRVLASKDKGATGHWAFFHSCLQNTWSQSSEAAHPQWQETRTRKEKMRYKCQPGSWNREFASDKLSDGANQSQIKKSSGEETSKSV